MFIEKKRLKNALKINNPTSLGGVRIFAWKIAERNKKKR